jgi:hypothetical protein
VENKRKTPTGAQQKAGGNGECPTWRSYPDLLLKRLEEEDTRGWRCHWALLMGKVLEVRCTSGVELAVQWARVELAVQWARVELAVPRCTRVELAVQWARVQLAVPWAGVELAVQWTRVELVVQLARVEWDWNRGSGAVSRVLEQIPVPWAEEMAQRVLTCSSKVWNQGMQAHA